MFLFGYDTLTIGLGRVIVRFAARRILAIGSVSRFPPETTIISLFEQQAVMTDEHASTATREGQGKS